MNLISAQGGASTLHVRSGTTVAVTTPSGPSAAGAAKNAPTAGTVAPVTAPAASRATHAPRGTAATRARLHTTAPAATAPGRQTARAAGNPPAGQVRVHRVWPPVGEGSVR